MTPHPFVRDHRWLCLAALLVLPGVSLRADAPASTTALGSREAQSPVTRDRVRSLEVEIAALRGKLRDSHTTDDDSVAARKVIDTEALLVAERQLLALKTRLQEIQPGAESLALLTLQQTLNEARDEDERAALRGRQQAYQHMLASESIHSRRASQTATRNETALPATR